MAGTKTTKKNRRPLFIPTKNQQGPDRTGNITQPYYGTDMRHIQTWATGLLETLKQSVTARLTTITNRLTFLTDEVEALSKAAIGAVVLGVRYGGTRTNLSVSNFTNSTQTFIDSLGGTAPMTTVAVFSTPSTWLTKTEGHYKISSGYALLTMTVGVGHSASITTTPPDQVVVRATMHNTGHTGTIQDCQSYFTLTQWPTKPSFLAVTSNARRIGPTTTMVGSINLHSVVTRTAHPNFYDLGCLVVLSFTGAYV